jgi:hypothetical protein
MFVDVCTLSRETNTKREIKGKTEDRRPKTKETGRPQASTFPSFPSAEFYTHHN